MAVFFDIEHLPEFKNAVITIGTFDGVHEGHRAIINEVVEHAGKVNGESVLLTFEPHPRKLLHPNQSLGIITPLHSKMKLVSSAGIQHIVVVPFTEVFAHQSAHSYIEEFLVEKFHPHSIIIGYDHRFGHDRLGGIELLKKYAQAYKYELKEIPARLIDEAVVSSTKIRNAIKDGKIDEASSMLGRLYTLKGNVVHGNKLGRTIGFPTTNLQPEDPDQIIPATGIYAIHVYHRGNKYNAMLNIGYNPTVSDKNLIRIEANIFDFDADIYGDSIELAFVRKLREEIKFPSIDALKMQLHSDKVAATEVLKKYPIIYL